MRSAPDEALWRVIESRDRAFAKAHKAALEKEAEIRRLKAETTAKDEEIVEKHEEIQMLTRAAADRLTIIQQLQASREYKVGTTLLHPWQVLRQKL